MQLPQDEVRKIIVPSRRIGPLKEAWTDLISPLVTQMGLQVRFNTQTKQIELKIGPATKDIAALQKGQDYCRAFVLGFELKDCVALLRMDDLFIDGFDVDDVKTLHGEHLSRAIGRMVGKGASEKRKTKKKVYVTLFFPDGQTKFAIENTTRTRIVIAEKRVHLLGTFADIHVARDALVSLILGSPPNKVYAKLKTVAARMKAQ